MAMQAYNAGLDQLGEWETGTYRWVGIAAGGFDRTVDTVAALVAAATEISVTGYARVDVTGNTRTVNDTLNRILYTCDDPSWTGLDTGESFTAIVLYRFGTNDADSVPIGWWELAPPVATTASDPLVFPIVGSAVAYIDWVI